MVKHLALQSQIHIYGIDTGNFYTNNEARLHWKNHKIKIEKRNLKTEYNKNLEKISEINKKDTITNEDENEIAERLNPCVSKLLLKYKKGGKEDGVLL